MKILADQNIPFATDAFSALGDVTLFVGRDLTHEQIKQADVLLVRSVSKVNAALLQDTPVKFVATATIGTDHIDLDYLAHNHIGFASAPGSNATSASEYVLAALLYYAEQCGVALTSKTVGIVGYGNVGSRVANLLRAIGMNIAIYDPPRAAQFNDADYCDWQTILACDIVTAHVPLTRSGDYPTYKMFNADFFAALKPDTLFINTARGKAVDEAALLAELDKGKQIHLVLDVWCNEPAIDKVLMQKTLLSTAHIAGYAYDGKLRGTEMIYQATCNYFKLAADWSVSQVLNECLSEITVQAQGDFIAELNAVVQQVYAVVNDSDALRRIMQMTAQESATHFDQLRKHYPKRREFSHYKIRSEHDRDIYQRLGFVTASS